MKLELLPHDCFIGIENRSSSKWGIDIFSFDIVPFSYEIFRGAPESKEITGQ